jgi:Zn finger protein HypA/HybF involved in hydrogenase expression
MPSDELQGYCVACKKVFAVKWSETICPECEHKPMKEVLDFPEEDGLSLQP